MNKNWIIEFHDDFVEEFYDLPETVQEEIVARGELLRVFGPQLGRPHVDTLEESKHANMKEIRFDADNGVWRVAFAFDKKRKAIILVAGDKAGVSEKRFYKKLIKKADERFNSHLEEIKKQESKRRGKK